MGLLHDYDYEKYPEEHLQHTREPLLAAGVPEEDVRAIMSHGWDTIHVAIASDSTVKFKYFHYNNRKEREYTHDGKPYEVSPWTLLYDNSNYYLLAFVDDNIRTFRVDRMAEVKQGAKERQGKENIFR